MKGLREYDIDIIRLSNKSHVYEYDLGHSFFALFEDSLVEEGNLKAEVKLDKSDTMIRTHFKIQGSVVLECDRSLEEFSKDIDAEGIIVFKYGENFEELNDNLYTLPYDAEKLELGQYLYEFITLEIPYRKIHPKFAEEDEDDETDEIYYSVEGDPESETSEDEIDPRWKDLEKLKNK